MDMCICVTDVLGCAAETNTTVETNYTPLKINFKKWALQLPLVRRKKLLNKEIALRKQRERDAMALGNSLMVQWLGLRAFTAEGLDLIPSQGMDPTGHAAEPKREKKENCS